MRERAKLRVYDWNELVEGLLLPCSRRLHRD
jgi:hypothetical protein